MTDAYWAFVKCLKEDVSSSSGDGVTAKSPGQDDRNCQGLRALLREINWRREL